MTVARLALCALLLATGIGTLTAQEVCPRPIPGSAVAEPPELQSRRGLLRLTLSVRNERAADGSMRYCYVLGDGSESPTLRLQPGDLLRLRVRNQLRAFEGVESQHVHASGSAASDPCRSGIMSATSTNLHFHGLGLAPLCHQDEVLQTSIQPTDPEFEYHVRIPRDAPPGLDWYHPHIHGFSNAQVLGGASGALIIEGLERAVPEVAGLPERVLVIRDQDLLHPSAPPAPSEPVVPRLLLDRDGDAANNGTGFGKPAKDLSLNFVPVPYPDYPPAPLRMRPGEHQLWRVLNASAITYLNLAVLWQRAPQPLGLVAIDGVPLRFGGSPARAVDWVDHIGLPPGARAEFIVEGPPLGVPGLLVTRAVDTGLGGENDPNRALATLVADANAPAPPAWLPNDPKPLPPPARPWLGDLRPVRVRKLYFSEQLRDPADPNSATTFFITPDGEAPAAFDPRRSAPSIIVHQGDVEDWIVENRSTELHAFHIHQLHFQLLQWSGVPVNEPFVRDTVNVPYYNGRGLTYPSVRLRMDFRDPHSVGTFVYHCHLLEHEDAGMMGIIRVEPARGAGG